MLNLVTFLAIPGQIQKKNDLLNDSPDPPLPPFPGGGPENPIFHVFGRFPGFLVHLRAKCGFFGLFGQNPVFPPYGLYMEAKKSNFRDSGRFYRYYRFSPFLSKIYYPRAVILVTRPTTNHPWATGGHPWDENLANS